MTPDPREPITEAELEAIEGGGASWMTEESLKRLCGSIRAARAAIAEVERERNALREHCASLQSAEMLAKEVSGLPIDRFIQPLAVVAWDQIRTRAFGIYEQIQATREAMASKPGGER